MMDNNWPDISGRFDGPVHFLPVRVYYEDTDFSGFVYHANYLKFCERARSDCLRLSGIHHHELHWHESEGQMGFVVRRMMCSFIKPARIDDLLRVETRFIRHSGARMWLDQTVWLDNAQLFNAEVEAALIDGAGRPKRFPKAMQTLFNTLISGNST